MITVHGFAASGGTVFGQLCFRQREQVQYQATSTLGAEAERIRLDNAIKEAVNQLNTLAAESDNADTSSLFETHALMLEDGDFCDAIDSKIASGATAEAAAARAGEEFATAFAAMDDAYMRERSADIRDVASRLCSLLTDTQTTAPTLSEPVILVAEDLSPSDTVQLDKTLLRGFVTFSGSVQSHTAILSRTMGIPAVVGTGEIDERYNGCDAYLDGTDGTLYIEPDADTAVMMKRKMAEQQRQKALLETLRGKPNCTRDGHEVLVYANIGGPEDLSNALQNDCGGIGLFRSEFLYLGRNQFPTEEEQFLAYRTVIAGMGGRRVIIRTLDIGADKRADYIGLKKEENPALGLRAIRLCLTRPEIFRTQLRAIYRASAFGRTALMFPMICSLWEVQEAKALCTAVQRELAADGVEFGRVELGIMIETPAAVMISDVLAREVDFFSIGTNDLMQYTLAVDRQARNLGRYANPHHDAIMRMIRMTAENAHAAGKWIGVCGEMAADTTVTEELLRIGIDELSVSPAAVLRLRQTIRDTDLSAHA